MRQSATVALAAAQGRILLMGDRPDEAVELPPRKFNTIHFSYSCPTATKVFRTSESYSVWVSPPTPVVGRPPSEHCNHLKLPSRAI